MFLSSYFCSFSLLFSSLSLYFHSSCMLQKTLFFFSHICSMNLSFPCEKYVFVGFQSLLILFLFAVIFWSHSRTTFRPFRQLSVCLLLALLLARLPAPGKFSSFVFSFFIFRVIFTIFARYLFVCVRKCVSVVEI